MGILPDQTPTKLHAGLCEAAAEKGDLSALQRLRDKECPWNVLRCAYAAEGGHLEVLQWLREHDCPWDRRTCRLAALRGHLRVLDWSLDNGCPVGLDYLQTLSVHPYIKRNVRAWLKAYIERQMLEA
jgi:hypothetical protein